MARVYEVSKPLEGEPWHTYRPVDKVSVTNTGIKHNNKAIWQDAKGNWYLLYRARFDYPAYLRDVNYLKKYYR